MYTYLYLTIVESYILTVMCLFTIAHVLLTQVFKPARLIEYDAINASAFYLMLFCMIALPIAALYSKNYWSFIGLSTLCMVALFISAINHNDTLHPGNPGSIAFIIFPMFYVPALLISMLVY